MATEKKLRSAVYADVKNICKEVGTHLNIEYDQKALDLIGELTWKKLLLYGGDLEAFQKHAKRSTINTDDVKLLLRRNPSLRDFIESEGPSASNSSGKGEPSNAVKRKRKPSSVILID